ncbi:MAG: hypothetical protein KDE27_01165 [Planctomycetes bacterium]|nr:hypothetical protein [Planctomycetota bacterium]
MMPIPSRRSGAWLLAAAVAAPGLAQEPRVVERAAAGFELVFHAAAVPESTANQLADAAIRDIERFVGHVSKATGSRPPEPAVVHLYADPVEFTRVTGDESPWTHEVGGFVSEKGVGHVVLGPELDVELFAVTGLPAPALEWLLMVVARKLIAPAVPKSEIADWITWVLVVGTVETFTNPDHEAGVSAEQDFRRARLHYLQRADAAVTFTTALEYEPRPGNKIDWDWRLCHASLVAETLSTLDSSWARKLLRKPRLARGQSGALALRRAAASAVIGKDWKKAERTFDTALASNDPDWMPLSRYWLPAKQRSALVGPSAAEATIVSSTGKMPTGDYAIFGRAELGPGTKYPLNISFGWDQASQVTVGFNDGMAWISEWHEAGDRIDYKAKAEVPIGNDRPFAFRIEVSGTSIELQIDGEKVATWSHGGREVHMAIRIGVFGRAVWLEGLGYEPLG